jgi:Raf kinase inhibitor-like YbhB/YbcL family protein
LDYTKKSKKTMTTSVSSTFTLKSKELGGQLEKRHFAKGHNGNNLSPQLYWENAPEQTQCFAVTAYDLDAPTGSGFWHWVIFNIPPAVNVLEAGAGDPLKNLTPENAMQSLNDAGIAGYAGAAPPDGPAHRYLITVHALKNRLELDQTATPAIVGFHLHYATIGKASLLAYGQKS